MGRGLEQGRPDRQGLSLAQSTAAQESWQVSTAPTDNKLLSMQTAGQSQKQHSFSEICLPFLLSRLSLLSIVLMVAALGFGGLVSQPAELSLSP